MCSVVSDCDPMDCSPQAPLSIGLSGQEYCSGLPFPLPKDLPDQPTDQTQVSHSSGGFFTTQTTWDEKKVKIPRQLILTHGETTSAVQPLSQKSLFQALSMYFLSSGFSIDLRQLEIEMKKNGSFCI